MSMVPPLVNKTSNVNITDGQINLTFRRTGTTFAAINAIEIVALPPLQGLSGSLLSQAAPDSGGSLLDGGDGESGSSDDGGSTGLEVMDIFGEV